MKDIKYHYLNNNTYLYHGTVFDFDPNSIKTPCWLSLEKKQAHNHISYRHYGNKNGKIFHKSLCAPIPIRRGHRAVYYKIGKKIKTNNTEEWESIKTSQ